MELKPHQDLCSGRPRLWASRGASGTCQMPHQRARWDRRPCVDVPASARCGHSRCSAASVRAQRGNTPSPSLLPRATGFRTAPADRGTISNGSKGDAQGWLEQGPAAFTHGRMSPVKRTPGAASAAASRLPARSAGAKRPNALEK